MSYRTAHSRQAALAFRHDALKVELARFGEHDRALGGQRFAEHDAIDAPNEPQRLDDRAQRPVMLAWADHCDGKGADNVIALRRA
jgi:hypothetical protein